MAFEISKFFFRDPNINVLRSLEVHSETLDRITRSFGQVLASGQVQVHSFREELPTGGVMIVDPCSATIGYLNETRSDIHANHINIAKFSSPHEPGFRSLVATLQRWLSEYNLDEPAPNMAVQSGIETSKLPDALIFEDSFEKEYRACLKSLNVDEARFRYENVRPAYEHTYDWLYDADIKFGRWLRGKNPSQIYWISGKPGSGKSTLMKYAMDHRRTLKLLQRYSYSKWIIAGYFFHDRGTKVQKSIDGFLRDILRQILHKRRELLPLIYKTYIESAKESSSSGIQWTQTQLQDALVSLGSKMTTTLNLCLFVDALDEHDGDHMDLISVLTSLTRISDNQSFHLRLCLAGRPENVFKDAFRKLPGFAIHDYTTNDIRNYTNDRIRKANTSILNDQCKKDLDILVGDIIGKANGVFLWVRLVVDELIEGLSEGDSLEELKRSLGEIPTELGDLYSRAILRPVRRTSKPAVDNLRYETFVMFQIVFAAHTPLSLYGVLAAAKVLSGEKMSASELWPLSIDQMQRRLNSRSRGLLEAIDRVGSIDVQFIHQTMKEFINDERGSKLITENIGNRPAEGGEILIFRYIISQLDNRGWNTRDAEAASFATRHFSEYAETVERKMRTSASDFFDPAIKNFPPDEQTKIMKQLVGYDYDSHWVNKVANAIDQPGFQRLFFYVLLGLSSSVVDTINVKKGEIEHGEVCTLLLKAALFKTDPKNKKIDFHGHAGLMLETLLAKGCGDKLSKEQFLSLKFVYEHRISDPHQSNLRTEQVERNWEILKRKFES